MRVIYSGNCEYGLECIKGHMARSHLFMAEALRFSAGGEITPDAQQKIRLAREQLLCEDDFARAFDAPPTTKIRMLKLLAATRQTWKEMERSGVEMGFGSIEDVQTVAVAIQGLSNEAYSIDREYRLAKAKSDAT